MNQTRRKRGRPNVWRLRSYRHLLFDRKQIFLHNEKNRKVLM